MGEAELERALERAPLNRLEALGGELEEERQRLQALYGGFPQGSEQRRYLKRQIRVVAAQSGSVATSILFRGSGNVGRAGTNAGARAEEGATNYS